MATIDTDNFAKEDFRNYLSEKLGCDVKIESFKRLKNGAWQCTYSCDKRRCSTFISHKSLLYVKICRMIERSRQVIFDTLIETIAIAENGHAVTYSDCTCPDHTGEYSTAYQLKVDGRPVCKHNMAYARIYGNVKNFGEFVKLQQN